MRSANPGWEVTVLSTEYACAKLPCLRDKSVQFQSDMARLCALYEFGGVWLDASCICNNSVEEWVDIESNCLQGFSAPWSDENHPVLENWAFATPRQFSFMAEWKSEVHKACVMGAQPYCDDLSDSTISSALRPHLPYLVCHAAFMVVKQQRGADCVRMRKSHLIGGPFHYVDRVNWEATAAVKSLASAQDTRLYLSLIHI